VDFIQFLLFLILRVHYS